MTRSLARSIVLAILFVVPCPAWAAVDYSEETHGTDTIEVFRLTVTPAPQPSPKFKHRLLLREIDAKPGNGASYYYRAFLEYAAIRKRLRDEFGDEFDSWYGGREGYTPIDELPLDKIRKADAIALSYIQHPLKEATTRLECNWQLGIEYLRGEEVFSFILDEFQKSREVSRWLAIRTRLAIAERRYEDAIDTMRMNYRLAHDMSEVPFLVCGLIGLAIEGLTNNNMVDIIAAPNSPNLYWALTEIPSPLVDMRKAIRLEMENGYRILPFLHNPETADRSREEWNRLYTQAIREIATWTSGRFNRIAREVPGFVGTGYALVGYPHAKKQLIAQGMDRDMVESMAVGQVIAIYTQRAYQRIADEFEALWYVPFSESRSRERALEKKLENANPLSGNEDREVLPVASMLLPATRAARSAQIRLEREVAALRVIEALRIYAAEHDEKLPASLADVTEVPIPLNPATNEPFVYRLEGETALLELPETDGIPGQNRRFEISIRPRLTENQEESP